MTSNCYGVRVRAEEGRREVERGTRRGREEGGRRRRREKERRRGRRGGKRWSGGQDGKKERWSREGENEEEKWRRLGRKRGRARAIDNKEEGRAIQRKGGRKRRNWRAERKEEWWEKEVETAEDSCTNTQHKVDCSSIVMSVYLLNPKEFLQSTIFCDWENNRFFKMKGGRSAQINFKIVTLKIFETLCRKYYFPTLLIIKIPQSKITSLCSLQWLRYSRWYSMNVC